MYRRKSRYGRVCVLSVMFVLVAVWHVFVSKKHGITQINDKTKSNESTIKNEAEDLVELSLKDQNIWSTHVVSRHLLELANCTPRAVEQFPKGLFTQEQRKNGALVIHVLVVIYMFLALAVICDYYFVPSLEVLCEFLNLESDVAGATFMAAGSSAPELATAVIGVFIAKDDVGLGTVVGSAIYNVMFVISICGLFAGSVVYLHWWPMVRDCIAYTVSIAALVIVIYDGQVTWYEAMSLVVLYVLYIVFMYFNARLEAWFVPRCTRCFPMKHRNIGAEAIVLYDKIQTNGSITLSATEADIGEMLPLTSDCESEDTCSDIEHDFYQKKAEGYFDQVSLPHQEEPEPLCQVPEGCLKKIMWVVSLPLCTVLYMTTPDCRKQRWKKWFLVTFIMSLVWLSAFSFVMVWMITVIGFTVKIPDSIMGLTFVAFGVSLPDVVASLLVVKEGLGDMAVSNAVGSNVFDILICLGVPWLLQTGALNPGGIVTVYSEGLTYSSLTLLSTVAFLLISTHLNGWKLDKKFGAILLVVYILYTILACMYELNIFGYFHPEECPSSY
ncbi:sodium/potassium/calcium exchanger 5 isoform X3 [Patella vulgata]|uniref:sodium/potassium/calcium exchanger 5 isoform X3 n=1 Tax=Patella vulgata TaxID=6465 RepID=UPI00217F36C0|nr:sodium/potassium/calcium exchanger 5 isoform X3 [Patella vulgata]